MAQLAVVLACLTATIACSRPGARWYTIDGYFNGGQAGVLYDIDTEVKAVALTIDDGPDPSWTMRLLDVLAAHDAHATFFLIGARIEGNEELVDAIVASGHELGNHMTRDEPSIELEPPEFEDELSRAHQLLSRWAEPRFLRPGSGWYDERMLEIASRHGYRLALGSVYPLDANLAWSGSRRRGSA